MSDIFKLLRVHQYIKNLFIFTPLLFSFSFSNSENNFNTLLAFLLFSLLASSVYIFNDLMDIKEDQAHPKKRYRPLASGNISTQTAKVLIFLLALFALSVSLILNINLFIVLVSYFILNILFIKYIIKNLQSFASAFA
ncbi:MAG: UbiA family prenyltransferase [Bacteroidales bacterium]|nr:UbiA family prenyltransferase [Bacteroidales bacterium]